jgi:hypothetical protein
MLVLYQVQFDEFIKALEKRCKENFCLHHLATSTFAIQLSLSLFFVYRDKNADAMGIFANESGYLKAEVMLLKFKR